MHEHKPFSLKPPDESSTSH